MIVKEEIKECKAGILTWRRYDELQEFRCVRCEERGAKKKMDKKSKIRVEWIRPDGTISDICNGCNGKLLSEG